MWSFIIGVGLLMAAIVALAILWARWRRQMGGGWGRTMMSDGSITTTPTGYPEEMKGAGKKISPTDNSSAPF